MESLRGVIALVTGGARGLGRDMADALLGAGAFVVNADIRPDPDVRPRSRELTVTADISTVDGAERAVAACIDTHGRIDVVVNNAGVLMRTAKARNGITGRLNFWDSDADTVRLFLDVHAVGSFLVAKAAVPDMLRQGSGRIVTVSTSFSTMLQGGRTPYGPAKAAMECFAAIMADDLAGTGVTVNVLIPGHAKDGHHKSDERGPDGKRVVPRVPRGIMGPPVVWLASAESSGVTGRRFVAVDWDPVLPPAEAAAKSGAPIGWASLDR
ncbi:MAG TPA: SDR family oxidoreductase [Pseudonocardiaceae bacterium]|jgi:3-oxoacyl-[acyl-carrier protein] reductase|nr:SDR family oxidoreductase [Pseudonocardiaceae bacterium]